MSSCRSSSSPGTMATKLGEAIGGGRPSAITITSRTPQVEVFPAAPAVYTYAHTHEGNHADQLIIAHLSLAGDGREGWHPPSS